MHRRLRLAAVVLLLVGPPGHHWYGTVNQLEQLLQDQQNLLPQRKALLVATLEVKIGGAADHL